MIQRSKRSPPPREEASMNLTPLIDVIFVILVMFMVVAPLLNLEKVELAAGSTTQSMPSPSLDKSPIQIHVRRDNSLLVNQQKVSREQLPSVLSQLKLHYPDAKPLVFHDQQAHFGTYQYLKTQLENAGFDEMQIVLKPS